MTKIERHIRARLAAVAGRVIGPGEPQDSALATRIALVELDAARAAREHAQQVADLERQVAAVARQRDLLEALARKAADNFDALAQLHAAREPLDTRTADEIAAFEARAS